MNRYRRPYTRSKSRRSRRSYGRKSGIFKGILLVLAAVIIVTAGYFVTSGIASLIKNKPESKADDTPSGITDNTGEETKTVSEVKSVYGVYLPFDKISTAEAQSSILAFVKDTDINTVVIDIKAEDGKLLYNSALPEAIAAASVSESTVDMASLCTKLKSAGVYVVGRVVCFKDNFIPRTEAGRAMSVKNADGSRRWDTYSWMNPYSTEAKNYLLGIIKEAGAFGFDEIMLDEVKFPDSIYLAPQLSYADTANGVSKPDALNGFVNSAADIAHSLNIKLSLSVPASGAYTDTANEESGQTFNFDSLKADYLCPYFQPSLLKQATVYGNIPADVFANAETSPYNAVKAVTAETLARLKAKNSSVQLRPWIQDYSTATTKYTATEIKAQITALKECGCDSYLSYDSDGVYTSDAYK